jgi:O-antigen ligase
MTPPARWLSDARAVAAARAMAILVLCGILISPPVSVLGQLGLVVLFASSGHLRSRFAAACRQPLGAGTLLFLLVIALGVPFSAAGLDEALRTLWGWRKLLVVPVGLALFDSAESKLRLLRLYVVACAVMAVVSYIAFATRTSFPIPDPIPGIVVRNHSTQGAVFCLAAFGSAALAVTGFGLSRAWRWAHAAMALLLVTNVVLVTTGRTGYLVLLVCACALALGSALELGHRPRVAALAGATLAGVLLAALLLTPASRARIDKAVHEVQTYRDQPQLTSMGIRIVFWVNSLALVRERPVLGWGTGAFETAYRAQVQGVTGVPGTIAKDPHNQYLSIAGEHGLVGLAVFLGFIASAFRQRPSRRFAVLGLGALAAWCATSMANSHFATFGEGTLLYAWMGAMLARERDPPAA